MLACPLSSGATPPSLRMPYLPRHTGVDHPPVAIFAPCCPLLPDRARLDSEQYLMQPGSITFPPPPDMWNWIESLLARHGVQLEVADVNSSG